MYGLRHGLCVLWYRMHTVNGGTSTGHRMHTVNGGTSTGHRMHTVNGGTSTGQSKGYESI